MVDHEKEPLHGFSDTHETIDAPPVEITEEQTTSSEGLQKELDDVRDQLLRAFAEMENIRRRSQKERDDAQKFAVSRFAHDLLSVSDNLRRALTSIPSLEGLPENVCHLIQGITMTEQELLSAFEKAHIRSVQALHQKFDPAFHQAVVEVETTEHAPGVVVQVIQEGYVLHDRLLRPALVGVAKAPQGCS